MKAGEGKRQEIKRNKEVEMGERETRGKDRKIKRRK